MLVQYLGAPSSKTNVMVQVDSGAFFMRPNYKLNYSDKLNILDDGKGDNPISNDSIVADGSRVFSGGWSTGFAEHTIANDGTLTLVYNDAKPDGSYTNVSNFAVDKTNKLIVVGRLGIDRFVVYDYSGGAISKTGTITPSSCNIQTAKAGYYYFNGIAFAGSWMYIGPYDSKSEAYRYNVHTDTAENLTVANKGSNTYRSKVVYHSETDRIFILAYSGGGVWVVDNASTASPDAWYMSPSTLGFGGNNCYNGGAYYISGNDIYLMANRKIAKVHVEKGNYYRIGNVSDTIYSSPYNGAMGIHHLSNNTDMPLVMADRGWNRTVGFYDMDNDKVVASPRRAITPASDKVPSYYDYGPAMTIATAPDDTEYLVTAGYGGYGPRFLVFDAEDSFVFNSGNWEAVFTGPTISSSHEAIHLNLTKLYTMNGATFNAYYSRDNGSTWYSLTPNTTQDLQGTGTTLKIKFSGTCTATKCAYIRSGTPPAVILLDEHVTERAQPATQLGRSA